MSDRPVPAEGEDRVALILWGDVIEDYLDRIGLTVDEFLREVSSGWTFGYIEALRSSGVETTLVLVTSAVRRPRPSVHAPSGTAVWLLPPSALFRAASRAVEWLEGRGPVRRTLRAITREVRAYSATPIIRLARVTRRGRVRAVLCQEYETPRFDVCVLAGRMLGAPVFATFQGGSRQHHRLERVLRPCTLRRGAGLVIGPAVEVGRVTERYGIDPDRIASIGNPVPAARGTAEARRHGREELGAGDGTVIVAWHGRVEIERKGLDVLVEAWRLVLEGARSADVRLVLMGTGGDAERLRTLLAPLEATVTWVDEYVTDRARIDRLLAAADVYVFPSPHEGFPVAPLEAMATGTPVVATAAPGVEDIFEGGEASGGIVVPVGDVEGLARSLLRVVDDHELRATLADRARRRVEEQYSTEAVGRELRRFLSDRGAHLDPETELAAS